MIFMTRALPFMLSKLLKDSDTLKTVGNHLPAYIMLLLVIYEVGMKHFTHYPYAAPAIIALAVLTLIHAWKRQLLLSVLVGTVVYVLVKQIFF